jgi:hypothetical protein
MYVLLECSIRYYRAHYAKAHAHKSWSAITFSSPSGKSSGMYINTHKSAFLTHASSHDHKIGKTGYKTCFGRFQ